MKSLLFSKAGLILLALVSCIAIGFAQYWGRSYRFDLTDNHLFTLSHGSEKIIESIDQPIEFTLFFSNQQTKTIPELRNYAQRVRDLLKEYALRSNGKLKFIEVDPEPFSEAEDQASEAGLKGVPLSEDSDPIYFGLMGTNDQGKREIIAFFSPERESFLEYDISQMIYRLTHVHLNKIGLMTSLPMSGGFDVMQQTPTAEWMLLTQIKKLYEVQELPLETKKMSSDIETLLLVHPKELSASALYALDQFVLRGGRLLVFIDPWAESDQDPHAGPRSSNELTPLFKQWGIRWSSNQVVGDLQHALLVNVQSSPQPVYHLALLGLTADSFQKNHVAMDQLEKVNLASAGMIQPIAGATTIFTPLMQSSTQSMLIPKSRLAGLKDVGSLLNDFKPTGKRYTLMADIAGAAKSAFIAPMLDNDGTALPYLAHSKQPIHVMVIADTDLLTDRMWVQVRDFFGQSVASPFANNSDLVTNFLDYISGSSDLIKIRSRDHYERPFDRVNALQVRAEQAFKQQEHVLRMHLDETERQLASLKKVNNPEEDIQLTPQQQQALAKFQKQKLKIRKELRDVRHGLDQDIRHLGLWLKVINILAVPLILTLVACVFLWRKRKRVK